MSVLRRFSVHCGRLNAGTVRVDLLCPWIGVCVHVEVLGRTEGKSVREHILRIRVEGEVSLLVVL